MEIERKWMVNGWPEGENLPALPLKEEFAMRQGYISVRPTVRIREEALKGGETAYILCFKPASGLEAEDILRLAAGQGFLPDADRGPDADIALPHGKFFF